jgi:hypothetical protein
MGTNMRDRADDEARPGGARTGGHAWGSPPESTAMADGGRQPGMVRRQHSDVAVVKGSFASPLNSVYTTMKRMARDGEVRL